MSAQDQRVLASIQEHGWIVQGVSDLGCEHPDHDAVGHRHTGLDPYLYTVGLTAAGLPELVLRLTGKNSLEWLRAGTTLLNAVARHTLHRELAVGETLPTGIGSITVTVQECEPFFRDDGGIWPGQAFRLYGRNRVRALLIEADW